MAEQDEPQLMVHDTITVKSQEGDCKIELCFGDITKLQMKDKVDVIFVSALAGSYEKVPGTLICALYRNLRVDVGVLSSHKEEDLRSLYSCWWSKPLSTELPYRRLLCFESRSDGLGRPQELVGHAFRCLVPILKNKEASVITPILSTGVQRSDANEMLSSMVHTAVSWVKAGLPIRLLKIVIYASIKDGKPKLRRKLSGGKNLTFTFENLKAKYEYANLIPQEVQLEYDVYLSYSEKDQEAVRKIQERLLEEKPDIRIFPSDGRTTCDDSSQEPKPDTLNESMDVMTKSARVITDSYSDSVCDDTKVQLSKVTRGIH